MWKRQCVGFIVLEGKGKNGGTPSVQVATSKEAATEAAIAQLVQQGDNPERMTSNHEVSSSNLGGG